MIDMPREIPGSDQAALATTAQQVARLYGFLASLYREFRTKTIGGGD